MRRKSFARIVVYVFIAALAATMLAPFMWMVATSLMGEREVYSVPPKFVPDSFRWKNYAEALTLQPFHRYFVNSLIVALASVAGQILFCSMAAYAFVRLQFRYREKVFALYLSTMMIPAIVTVIPAFLLISIFGWMNTYWALITPSLSSVWGIFLLRQFFGTIPKELADAARMDGASEFSVFRRIYLPLAKPALATLAVFAFLSSWKDFLWPLIVTNKQDMRTLEIGIAAFSTQYGTHWPYQMAAAVAVLAPLVIVFFLAQKHFVKGITMTGIKG